MAKWQVVLSNTSQLDRLNILNYWLVNNKSASYSRKLDAKFIEVFNNLKEYPLLGVSTIYPDVRAFVILNYKIFYQIRGNVIFIIRIWDTRQNPNTLKL